MTDAALHDALIIVILVRLCTCFYSLTPPHPHHALTSRLKSEQTRSEAQAHIDSLTRQASSDVIEMDKARHFVTG